MIDPSRLNICVVGLGYVGLPLAVAFVEKGYPVLGFDLSKRRIDELRRGVDSTGEIQTDELRYLNQITVVSDLSDASQTFKADSRLKTVYIVTVPTPIDDANQPDLSALRLACQSIGQVLRSGDVVVFESTVYPGATRSICVPELERLSGLSCSWGGANVPERVFYVGYSPERINPGDKKNTFKSIKKVVSGADVVTAQFLSSLYGSVVDAGIYVAESIEIAEAAKAIENAQRDINIAFVNELALIFSKMGIDTHQVLKAASTKWNFLNFQPGLVGGHCIGVDPYYLAFAAQLAGYTPDVVLAGRRTNESVADFIASQVTQKLNNNFGGARGRRVAVFGVTFKENTPDFRNTQVTKILNYLKRWQVDLIVVDPLADPNDFFQATGIELTQDIFSVRNIDLCVFAVSHEQFTRFEPADIKAMFRDNTTVVEMFDVKAMYDVDAFKSAGITVTRF